MKLSVAVAAVAVLFFYCGSARAGDDSGSSEGLFKKLDANGDGKLTASEIPQEHRKSFERLLRIGDADKNGELSRAEFDAATKQKEEPVTDLSKVGGLGGGPVPRGKPDPNRIFKMLDKNKDGKLTRDEVAERPAIKALFDRLGKEELTLEDLSALGPGAGKAKGAKKAKALAIANKMGPKSLGAGATGQMPSTFFRLLDTNHDGKLSKEELSKAATLFDQLDKNQDGFLDPQEILGLPGGRDDAETPAGPAGKLKRARKAGIGAAGRKANLENMVEMMMKADKDGDGKISKQEAPPQLSKHFAKIDKNNDGFLDKSEIEAAVRHRRKNARAVSGLQNPAP